MKEGKMMAKLTFMGGIFPEEGKKMSQDKPIREVNPKGDLVFPLSQHMGAMAVPVVSVGEHVLQGQKIAEADGELSAAVFSSVSGKIKSIEPRRVVSGEKVNSIIIENDNRYVSTGNQKVLPLEELKRNEILHLIKEAGISGMGGVGFPTHVKLSPKDPDKIYYVIVNGAECEPYMTSDYRRMKEEPEKVLAGLKVLMKLFKHAKGIIAIEENKDDLIRIFRELTRTSTKISVRALKAKYPQGAEKQIIYATTGRAINSTMQPQDAGCIVENADTVMAIADAVYEGTPLIYRTVTVTGEAIRHPQNFKVRIGMDYSELIDEAGGFIKKAAKIIVGGPLMGVSLFDTNVPVTKCSSGLLCLAKDDISRFEPTACIRCGKCVEVCPSRIVPTQLADFADHNNMQAFLKGNGMECCECGCCSYICPAKKRLTQSIKSMRKMELENRKKLEVY